MDRFFAKFVNLNFYLSLIPFRVELVKTRNKNYGDLVQRYKIRERNVVEGRFAGIILGLDIFQGIFLTRGAYWGKIVKYPSVLFLIWKTIHHSLILGLLWAWTFWRRRKRSDFKLILDYLLHRRLHSDDGSGDYEEDDGEGNNNKNLWHAGAMWTFLISFGLLFPIGVEFVRMFNVDGIGRPPTLEDNFRLSSAQILFDLSLVKNHTYISAEDFSTAYFSTSVFYMILRTWGKVMLGMAHTFTFLTAVTFYSEVNRLHSVAFSTQYNPKHLIQQYLRFCRLVHSLNNVNRPILLCLVSASVPLFVLRVIHAWDSPQFSIKFIILVKLIQFLVIASISAEANDKAISLKSQMLEVCHEDRDGGRAWAGSIFREDLALDSGRFVKISYGFIGSMLSAYLSYAIMLLQITPCIEK